MSLLAAADVDEMYKEIEELRDYIKEMAPHISPTQSTVKVNAAHTAAVAQDFFWIPVEEVSPPMGVKLLLINQKHGVACMGDYYSSHGWTHWQGLPKFKTSQ